MGRERTNPFRNFFVYDPASDTSTCTIGNCRRVMSGQHAANLERHVRYVHPEEIHRATRRAARSDKESAGPLSDSGEPSGKRSRSAAGGRPFDPGTAKKPRCVPVKITAAQIRDACAELVTANGRPFSLMEDTGFRKLIDPLLEGLRGPLVISAEGVRESVGAAAAAARDLVRGELRGRLVCLKLDAVSRDGRSALGVHAQYARDGALVLRTLAAKELTGREDLAAVAVDVLREYGVDVADVYSVTTDDGADGADGAGRGAWRRERRPAGEGRDDEPAAEEEEDDEPGSEIEDATAVRLELAELRLKEISGARSLMRSVRCAGLALHLAVADALEEASVASLLSEARRVCRRLRTRPVAASLHEENLKMPAVDGSSRWLSTYDMLEDLLDLRDFCRREAASIPNLTLSDDTWRRLRDLLAALKPARVAAETFRTEHLTVGDFYGAWLRCHLDTASAGSEFSPSLARAVKRFEKQLLGNDAVVAAVFMDPRYGVLLTDRESDRARQHLRRAWAALEVRGRRRPPGEPQGEPATGELAGGRAPYGECDELERLLRARNSDRKPAPASRSWAEREAGADVDAALQALDGEPRLKKDADVLAHWESWRHSKPELFQLAQVALSVPVTQASVERVFSALEFIQSPDRCDLSGQTLDDILMVRLNEVFGH